MGRWFRLDDDVVNDHKVQSLPDALFKAWINILCLASKNGGKLPSLANVAFSLRVTEAKAAEVLTKLHQAELLDKEGSSFEPHNWSRRQFKSDEDPTAASRAKRYRDKKRDSTVTVTRDASHRDAVSRERPDTDTETDTDIDRIGSARATSKFTEGSKALTQAFWKALGFKDALSVPPEFAGVDWRAIEWEAAGWTPDLIEVEAKRIGPAKPLSYHEKVFATAYAKRNAALPVAENSEVTHAKSSGSGKSVHAAIRRIRAGLEGNLDRAAGSNAVLVLPES